MIEKKDLFPTPVFSGNIENFEEMNKVLIEIIYKLRDSDKGVNKSNILGWHSKYNLHIDPELHEIPEFLFLKNSLIRAANIIIKTMGYKIKVMYSSMWANVNQKHASNQIHDHPPALLSGAYYLKIPQPVSNFRIYDPRPVKAYISKGLFPNEKIIDNEYTVNTLAVPPVEGNFIIFPGWLKHSVETNLSDDDRISVSFNFIFHKYIED